jgi:hypothetical protein
VNLEKILKNIEGFRVVFGVGIRGKKGGYGCPRWGFCLLFVYDEIPSASDSLNLFSVSIVKYYFIQAKNSLSGAAHSDMILNINQTGYQVKAGRAIALSAIA